MNTNSGMDRSDNDSTELTGGIFQHIRNTKNQLPRQQRVVCEYILNNYHQVAFLTAEELAKSAGTGTATVLRTASNLGYENFRSVKEEIKKILFQSAIPPLDRLMDSFAKAETPDTLERVIKENIKNLETMKGEHLVSSFPRAVKLISEARRIYIFGLRSTRGLAVYLHALLHQFLPDIYMIDSTGSDNMMEVLSDMNENDVLISLMAGSPHYTRRTIYAVQYAHNNSIPTVLITNSLSSSAAPLATELLLAPQNTSHYSTVSLITIIDALVVEVGHKRSDTARKKLEKLSTLLVDYDISI